MTKYAPTARVGITLSIVAIVVLSVTPVAFAQSASAPLPQNEPATPEVAARLLDLRTFPTLDGARVSIRSLAILLYSAKGLAKDAFEFQAQELTKRGFQELPGRSNQPTSMSSYFAKDGFNLAVSASEVSGDPKRAGWSEVAIVNAGNIPLDQLPTPPGAKSFHSTPHEACYTTTASPADTAAACRELLLAAGWEPSGQSPPSEVRPDMSMHYFKRNAMKLQSWIMTTPAEGGKTLIRYSAELLKADLPAPTIAADLQYDDLSKTLHFTALEDQTAAILAFYQQRLSKQGWQPTTDRPIVDDQKRTQFLVFRNAQKDLLALDLREYTDKVEVRLRHKSAAQMAEEERLAEAAAIVERQKLAEKNKRIQLVVPLLADAKELQKKNAREWEYSLKTGRGPATLEMYREHFRQAGWTEKTAREFDKTSGALLFEKDGDHLRVGYFDLGLRDVSITLDGSERIVLAVGQTTPAPAAVPGAASGVEPPVDIDALVKKAIEEVKAKKQTPPKRSSIKKATP